MTTNPLTATETLPVLPLPDGVVLPEMVVTITIQSAEAAAVLEAAGDGRLLLVPKIDGVFANAGVIATVVDRESLGGRVPAVTVRAESRARVGAGVIGSAPVLWVEAEELVDPAPTAETEALGADYRAAATALLEKIGGRQLAGALRELTTPGALADSIGYWPELSLEQRVELLEATDVSDRLRLATGWVKEALADIDVQQRINKEVTDDLEKGQREAILRRQMAAIRAELGEGDDDIVGQFRAKLDELTGSGADPAAENPATENPATENPGADRAIEPATAEAITREIDRLERTGTESMEANWIRTWLDTVFELPWTERSDMSPSSTMHARSSMPTTPASTRSRTDSSSISPSASCGPSAV